MTAIAPSAKAIASGVWARFFMDSVEDPVASAAAGRPVHRDVERVEINFPGNPLNKPVKEVTNVERERWPEEYEAFKRGQDVAVSGTPIEHLTFLKKSQVFELKALGFMTVEHLADMSDIARQRVGMYALKLKELAQAYLDDAKAMAILTVAQADNERKDAEIAALKLQVENMQRDMQQMFAQLTDKQNAHHPLAVNVPALHDPIEMMKMGAAPAVAQSSLEDLPAVPARRRGKAAEAAAT